MFERRTNFDLRRLLGGEGIGGIISVLLILCECCLGAEPFLHTLLQRLEGDMAISLSSLQFLKLDPSVRSRAAEALVPVSKMKVPDCIPGQKNWWRLTVGV